MKKWVETLSTAWVGMVSHKLRSFLTILGIVIGVATVITLMSIGRGAEADIVSRIEALGSNLIFISPGATSFGGIKSGAGSAETLTLEDAVAISEQVPYVSEIAPSFSTSLQVVFGGENMRTPVIGITPEYQQVNNLQTVEGNFISEYDYQRGAKVAVIGSNVAETLFSGVDPIGQILRGGNIIVRVIGVLEAEGASIRGLADDAILIPLTAMQQMVAQLRTSSGEYRISSIALTVSNEEQANQVTEDITSLLRYRHQLGTGVDDDFNVTSIEEIVSTLSETIGTMTLLLGAIAAISLLVGGIGVMNITLVSVLERTREIGIRKALGARERDIWSQFLIEAVFLTLVGGIIGVIVGWVVSSVVPLIWSMPTLVTADIVILAVSVSVGVGLFFGFYPAWNASRLNPIEALRHE
ncbi:ABC transporter permease [Chloroflexota bacterium]